MGKKIKDIIYLGGFIAFTVIILHSVVFHIRDCIWGALGVEDTADSIWLYWAWKYSLQKILVHAFEDGFTVAAFLKFLRNFLNIPKAFYVRNYIDFIFIYFVDKFLPFPIYHNLKIVITFVLNGFSFYLLGTYLYKNRFVAFVTGAMFASMPVFFTLVAYGYLETIYIFPIPLAFLYLIKMTREENILTNAVLTGVFMGISGLFYWFWGLFTFLASFIYIVWFLAVDKDKNKTEIIKHFLLVLFVCCVITFPFLYPYSMQLVREGALEQVKLFQSFPQAVSVGHLHKFERNTIVNACSIEYPIIPVGNQYFPPILLLLFIASFVFVRKIPIIWHSLASIFYILSLGPYIKAAGEPIYPIIENPLYLFLYKWLPFFSRFQWPFRLQVFFVFFTLIVVGYTLSLFSEEIKPKAKLTFAPALISLIIFLTGIYINGISPTVTPYHLPELYSKIRQEESNIGIIDLPFNCPAIIWEESKIPNFYCWDDYKVNMYYQSFHHKKVLDGYFSCKLGYPSETDGALTVKDRSCMDSFILYLISMSYNPKKPSAFHSEDLEYIKLCGYKYLVVHKRYFKRLVMEKLKKEGLPKNSFVVKRLVDKAFREYIAQLERIFGPPVYKDVEYLWDVRLNLLDTTAVSSRTQRRGVIFKVEENRDVSNLVLEVHPVYFFSISNYQKGGKKWKKMGKTSRGNM